jgi:hypothetical protein
MHSLLFKYLSSLSLTVEDARTLQRLGEYKGRQELFTQQTPQILHESGQHMPLSSSLGHPKAGS